MAQGTIVLFEEFAKKMQDGTIDVDTHTWKFAFVTLSVTGGIAATDANPCWGAGGTTNLATSEVTPGGGYTTGGATLTSVTLTETGGVATFDSADVVFTSSASGDPATIKTGILYSDTATNKDAAGFVDMTTDAGTTAISLLAGNITFSPHVTQGWMQTTVNA